MTAERMTLAQCGQQKRLHSVPAGQYSVEYADSTHLDDNAWVQLGSVRISVLTEAGP